MDSPSNIAVIPTSSALQTPSNQSGTQGCGQLIAVCFWLAVIGSGLAIAFSEAPLGYRLATGRQRLDGSLFTFRIEDRLVGHDKYVAVNNSPHNLKAVNISFVTTFVDGGTWTTSRYWHEWLADSGKRCDAAGESGASLRLIEKVTVYAYSDKYFFSHTYGARE